MFGLHAVDGETVLEDGTSGVERLEGGLVGVLEILVASVGEGSLLHGLGHSGFGDGGDDGCGCENNSSHVEKVVDLVAFVAFVVAFNDTGSGCR